jgi:tryprostatin B 6-hydroxylase
MAFATLLLFAAGIASHAAYFRRGEHHLHAIRYIQTFVVVYAASVIGPVNYTGQEPSAAFVTTTLLSSAWLAGVYSSLLIYRAFFHPLSKFPAPSMNARLGSLWLTTHFRGLDGYQKLQEMHENFGRYVRVGPNTLSITDPEIMQPAFGAGSKCIKADWYDVSTPRTSMHTSRSKQVHDRRRRVWAPAFSDKALREYESVVSGFNKQLLEKFGKLEGQAVNVSTWFNLYSFDIMGRLAFGKEYGMVEAGERHWALDLLVEGMELTGFRIPVWLSRVMMAIPGLTAGYWKFIKFCQDELKWRVENEKSSGKDISGWLLKAYAGEEHPERDPMLVGKYH